MISPARSVLKRINEFINIDDVDFIRTLERLNLEIKCIATDLETHFDGDSKLLKQKSNIKGLNNRYGRLEKDVVYRIGQAFLHEKDIKQNRTEQFVCVVARLVICRIVALSHLKQIDRLMAALGQKAKKLKEKSLQPEGIKYSLRVGHDIDRIKGYGREANSIVEDYCHFYDLAFHLLGHKAELYGSRHKADVYNFQLDSAIRELFVSRTESCDAAPFLIRSHLELKIRRLIFNEDVMNGTRYVPSKELSISELLKSCRRNGIHFNYSNDILELLLENLNLVVHFGFKLSSALLWYIYFVTDNLQVHIEGHLSTEKPEETLKRHVIKVFNDLEKRKLVKKLEDTDYFKKRGLNIFWR